MSLFFKPFLSKWEWFMQMKNRCCWTKFTSPIKVSLSVLFDFRVLVTNIIVIMFYTELVSSFRLRFPRWYDYCVSYHEVYYFQLPGFVQFWSLKFVLSNKVNLNFKILSLNVRGIRSCEKRRALFINKQRADIIFLQEGALFKTLVEEISPK